MCNLLHITCFHTCLMVHCLTLAQLLELSHLTSLQFSYLYRRAKGSMQLNKCAAPLISPCVSIWLDAWQQV